jgi:hypothetical protein
MRAHATRTIGHDRETIPDGLCMEPIFIGSYSILGITVNRKLTLKWLFPQEKAT